VPHDPGGRTVALGRAHDLGNHDRSTAWREQADDTGYRGASRGQADGDGGPFAATGSQVLGAPAGTELRWQGGTPGRL
jgi:hypothetical protein